MLHAYHLSARPRRNLVLRASASHAPYAWSAVSYYFRRLHASSAHRRLPLSLAAPTPAILPLSIKITSPVASGLCQLPDTIAPKLTMATLIRPPSAAGNEPPTTPTQPPVTSQRASVYVAGKGKYCKETGVSGYLDCSYASLDACQKHNKPANARRVRNPNSGT